MGKESLWNIWKMSQNKSFKIIIVVYVKYCNFGSHRREYEKYLEFSNYFISENIDSRFIFEVVHYESELIGIQKLETEILVNQEELKEPLAKLQYCQLLCSKIISENNVGTFVIPMDFEERSFSSKSHFSDQPISFLSFQPFLCQFLGARININFNGLNVTRLKKVLKLLQLDWLRFNSSCYQNWNYFGMLQKKNNIPINLNMCGSCFKCKVDLKIYKELNII